MLRTQTVITGGAGAPYYSTFYFEGSGSGPATAAATATHGFWAGCSSAIAAILTINVLDDVEEVNPATGQTTAVWTAPTLTIPGAAVGDLLPPATQGLVRWRTGSYVNGRELRGKTFIPGTTEAQSTAGVPLQAYLDDITAAGEVLIGTSDFGIYSPTHRIFNLGATVSTWSQWAVLRSRRD